MKLFAVLSFMILGGSTFAQAAYVLEGVPPSVAKVHRALNADQCKNNVNGSTEVFELGSDVKLYIIP